ncbi:uncharacterized protein LOC125196258 [Salvia hispanica]|uniref:uncharacterized protein LOC125196258 n=1 Tax=Salvia hispanica TaxID=49212 RepID=UPI002008F94B|nr:uncharacterized protein LOC125196258 [Salvia hispanica]
MIRTTSISESENSFYKNFLKPRNNIAEFYLNFNQALEFPILATTLPFEKHASTTCFKKIQEEIVEGNDKCCVLGFSSTDMVDTYKLGDSLRNSYFVRHDKTDESYSCDCKLFSRWMKTLLAKAVHGGLEELGNSLQTRTPTTSAFEKRRMIEQFYGMERPEVVEVHPPDVVKTKGHASSSASRLISKRLKAIKEATRPLRRCKACDELCHHDSRNCPMLKELEKENELRKGKRKC